MQTWMTDMILDLMDERRHAKNQQDKHKIFDRTIKKLLIDAKEIWT